MATDDLRAWLARTREDAAKATPGPWAVDREDAWTWDVDTLAGAHPQGVARCVTGSHPEANAAHIARCDPATIALLCEVVDRLAEQVEREGRCEVCGGDFEDTVADDDNPEGLVFRHRAGCPLARLAAHVGEGA